MELGDLLRPQTIQGVTKGAGLPHVTVSGYAAGLLDETPELAVLPATRRGAVRGEAVRPLRVVLRATRQDRCEKSKRCDEDDAQTLNRNSTTSPSAMT